MSRTPEGFTRLNADIPEDLHQEFKIVCLKEKKTMTDVMTFFITHYVKLYNTKRNNHDS